MTRQPASTAPVLRAAHVPCPPEQAFTLFTDHIGAWWPLTDHGMFGAHAVELGIVDGRLIERAEDGRSCVWGQVVVWEPPSRLVLTWHPGREAEDASEVAVSFVGDADGTRVELVHRGWERFGVDAVARRRTYTRPDAWGHVLDHYCDVAEAAGEIEVEMAGATMVEMAGESGPAESAAAPLAVLAKAYEEFFAEAQRGGFGPPPAGEWDALQVVAHVALSDQSLAAVSRALVHGQAPAMDNTWCQEPDVLAAAIARHDGDLTRLIQWAREQARVALLAAARLDPQQQATQVPCRMRHDGQVVLDEPRPWGSLAIIGQARMHLPAHTGQLRDLR